MLRFLSNTLLQNLSGEAVIPKTSDAHQSFLVSDGHCLFFEFVLLLGDR